jgi:galactokinase
MNHLSGESQSRAGSRYRAPGRVNLIGEHTDYNDGFVMPAAIDLYTEASISPRDDRRLFIYSANFSESVEIDLDDPNPRARGHWSDYVCGVAVNLECAGYRLKGADIEIGSNVPIGSGLSSSAALEVVAGYAILKNSDIEINRVELARLCQRAENDFVGMRCGIMDQFISCFGRAGRALMLDCRSLEYQLLPLPENVRLVICNTMVKHELSSSKYNTRRAECEAGARHFAESLPNVRALRDVTMNDFERHGGGLSEAIFKRCRHVIAENERVLEAAAALERDDLRAMGELMAESHRSLRDDYEVSCAELDTMVDLAAGIDGVYGARMTGGGFGGCTINLVDARCAEEFKREIARCYEEATHLKPDIYVCATANGVEACKGVPPCAPLDEAARL